MHLTYSRRDQERTPPCVQVAKYPDFAIKRLANAFAHQGGGDAARTCTQDACATASDRSSSQFDLQSPKSELERNAEPLPQSLT